MLPGPGPRSYDEKTITNCFIEFDFYPKFY